VELNGNKLGLHIVYGHGYAGALGRPATIKLLDPSVADVGTIRDRVGPDCLIDVRFYEHATTPSSDHARAMYDRRRAQMLAMRVVGGRNVCFESPYNEPDRARMGQLVAAESAWLEQMHRDCLRAVVGNWAVGNPDPLQWCDYMPVLDALAPGDALGLHDYWAERADILNSWYVGRWAHPLAPDKLRQVAIVVTECGRDVIQDRARHGKDPGKPGWKRTASWDEYHADLRLYAETVLDAPNVIGAHVFQAGANDHQWDAFDLAEHWPVVVAGYSTSAIPQPEPPQEEPIMLPIPGARVSQRFGERPNVYGPLYAGHPGVDLTAPSGVAHIDWHGTPVRATIAGTAYVVRPAANTDYGVYVYVKGNAADELLAHLADANDTVNGRWVEPGDVVGFAGYSGNCEPVGVRGCHLHWGIRPKPYAMNNGFRGYCDPLK
jgi:murein DD-endopeptidase MepM/ murein hydrolase activator NlpD